MAVKKRMGVVINCTLPHETYEIMRQQSGTKYYGSYISALIKADAARREERTRLVKLVLDENEAAHATQQ